jgi:hypothetical protein
VGAILIATVSAGLVGSGRSLANETLFISQRTLRSFGFAFLFSIEDMRMWITYFNAHFYVSEMPTISRAIKILYSFHKEHCGVTGSSSFLQGFIF